jgi:hypothetical protein
VQGTCVTTQVVGTVQYIEWLILIDRVQPSLIAGVTGRGVGMQSAPPCKIHTPVRMAQITGRGAIGGCLQNTQAPPAHRPPLQRLSGEHAQSQTDISRRTPHLVYL